MKKRIYLSFLILLFLFAQSLSFGHGFSFDHLTHPKQDCELCQIYDKFSSTALIDQPTLNFEFDKYIFEDLKFPKVVYSKTIILYFSQGPPNYI